MKFNDNYLMALKGDNKRVVLTDPATTGLSIQIEPSGRKTWYWKGRMPDAAGKLTVAARYKLGTYPAHTLVMARTWANDIEHHRQLGVDIVKQREAEKKAAAVRDERTVNWLFEAYMDAEGGQRSTQKEKRRAYRVDVEPEIGTMHIADVSYDDLAKIVLEKFKATRAAGGSGVQANRLMSLLCRLFRWAVTKGRPETGLTANPAADLVKPATERKRKRVLSRYELGLLLDVLEGETAPVRMAYQTMILTGVRADNAWSACWRHYQMDTGRWLIDGLLTKNDDELMLTLSPEHLALLRRYRAATATSNSKYLYPSRAAGDRDGDRPMTGLSRFHKRIRTKMETLAAKNGETIERWTCHDLRRTLRTELSGLRDTHGHRFKRDAIEALINHRSGVHAGVSGIYDRYEYEDEIREALAAYSTWIFSIRPALRPVVENNNVENSADQSSTSVLKIAA